MVFGLDRKSIASFEKHPDNSPEWMDCFWEKKIIIEMKSSGENLDEAMDQALGYYVQLKKDQEPRYILICDFQNWYLRDKKENTDHFFILSDFEHNIGLFGFMTNRPKVVQADPVNIKASEIMGKVYDLLKESGYPSYHAEYFLTRLVFCLFADDTGIFGDHGKFQTYLKEFTSEDGSDLGSRLVYLFSVLNQQRDRRSKTMDPKMRSFPYINGALFERQIEFPDFDSKMRQFLIDAGEYDWSKVSPVIFGNMFQTVMDQDARREMGAHYTSEENILKVIRPLFLDKLNEEFDEIDKVLDDSRKDRFIEFQNKLSSLKFLDPACGSGNFLVIAYREIRRLEHRIIMKIHGYSGKRIDTDELSKIDVDQFFGIEIIEFSAKIAETSLWMMDHLMNMELSKRYGLAFRRIPIKKKPNIVCKDALEFDWNEILPNSECSYVFGNPPFNGASVMNEKQKQQIVRITNSNKIDYVTGWFVKACEYISHTHPQIAFVATNSITQGEQVGQLWPVLFDRYNVNIIFAHKSFKWKSEAKGKAQVTVVIIGLAKNFVGRKQLFHYDGEKIIEERPKHISPYLVGSTTLLSIVKKANNPLNGLPSIRLGSKLVDWGHYVFNDEEKNNFLSKEPSAKSYFRSYIDGHGFLHNNYRWVLFLQDIQPNVLKKMPMILDRVNAVKTLRSQSKKKLTREKANTPTVFAEGSVPTNPYLAIPLTSSEKREYIPIGYLKPPIIPSNGLMIVENTNLVLFGLLTSRMLMTWVRTIGGKMETRLRYTADIHNTFPVPKDYSSLESFARKILDIRKKYPDSTLADLYDPITMPADLLKAHQKLDKAVEKLYRDEPFNSDEERLEFLLEEYQKMAGKQITL